MFTRLVRLTWVQWLVGLLILSGTAVYGLHLWIGYSPTPVALSLLGINLYGSAILIAAAVLLSAAVVYSVARHNAQQRFNAAVPQTIRQRPLDTLPLNPTFLPRLSRRRLNTVGALLFRWGLNPRALDFTDVQLTQLGTELLEDEQIKAEWIFSPAWRPFDPAHVWRGLSWMVVFGLIGARLYHILAPSPEFAARTGIASAFEYFQNPTQLINFSQGGWGIWGGILGGLSGLLIYSLRARITFLLWADLAAVGFAFGQAIGRWGDFLNQQLYGRPTSLPWAIHIQPAYRLLGYESFATYHPLFLYESLWCLALFALLYHLARHHYAWLSAGDLLALYLIGYASGRVLFETLRLDSAQLTIANVTLPTATAVALSLLFLMAAWRRFHYT